MSCYKLNHDSYGHPNDLSFLTKISKANKQKTKTHKKKSNLYKTKNKKHIPWKWIRQKLGTTQENQRSGNGREERLVVATRTQQQYIMLKKKKDSERCIRVVVAYSAQSSQEERDFLVGSINTW